jgi:hypothetical protein
MKKRYIFLSLLAAAAGACNEGIDTGALENTPSKIYLATSGLVTWSILDFGEDAKTIDISVNKSGYVNRPAAVSLAHDPSAVEDYASTNPGELVILPASVATFAANRVNMSGDETLAGVTLSLDLRQARPILAADPGARHVFPVRVTVDPADTARGVSVNERMDYLLLAVELLSPKALLANNGGLLEATVDRFREPSVTEVNVPLSISLPFENDAYSFDFALAVDPAAVAAYNDRNGTAFETLPEGCYTLPALAMGPGDNACSGNVRVSVAALPPLVGGRTYLLPVRVTDSGNESIPVEENAICYVKVKLAARWSGAWKNTIHAAESGLSTSPGYTYDTYLYSRADALALFTDFTIVGALDVITDEAAIVCPGWAGTMFEQCSPIIKVTDIDAGGGKKVVEILAGWAREGAGWEPVTTGNNQSTYDPARNEIYLDYTGEFGWGSYRIQRTYSDQVPL